MLKYVNETTDSVSQMAVVKKQMMIFVYASIINTSNCASKRNYYRLPIIDDMLPQLFKAKVFTKFDVKQPYWHNKLNDASSILTTMIKLFVDTLGKVYPLA